MGSLVPQLRVRAFTCARIANLSLLVPDPAEDDAHARISASLLANFPDCTDPTILRPSRFRLSLYLQF